MSQIQRSVLTGIAVGKTESFRPRPRFKILPASPDCVRRIEHMILPLRPAQEVKFYKAADLAQVCVARRPHTFKISLGSLNDFESVHRDEHGLTYKFRVADCGAQRSANITATPVESSDAPCAMTIP